MTNICFFTDTSLLLDQSQDNINDKAYGPIDTLNFRVTNLNTASSNPPAYAVCTGSVLVQKDSANGLYNLLIKPVSGLISDGFKIKYIIYKGIKSDSLIDNTNNNIIAPEGTNELIDSIWDTQNSENIKEGTSYLPSIKALGLNFDNNATGVDLRLDSDLIDEIFFLNGKEYANVLVKAGWKIGTFDKDKFGIEVILDDFGYNPAFKILRTNENIITVPTISPDTIANKIEDNANRSVILNYMDPICLFSMEYANGVTCFDSGASDTLKTTNLFSEVLYKFKNCSKVYLDIRNENGLYYNYYDNYENSGDKVQIDFGGGPGLVNFKTDSWPIKIVENTDLINPSPSAKNTIELFLPEGDNVNPLVYQANNISAVSFPNYVPNHKSRFVNIEYESGYSNGISCAMHNNGNSSIENVATYIKLYYVRRQDVSYVPSNSSIVYSSHTHFDTLFELHPKRINFDTSKSINSILYSDLKFIDAIDDLGFSGIVQVGACIESNRIVFFAVPKDVYLETELATEKLVTFTGGSSDRKSFFDDVFFNEYAKKITGISISGISAKIISLEEKSENNVIKKYAENIFCLGISKAEYDALNLQLSSFDTTVHPVYLGIDSVTHAVDSSQEAIPYSELSLSLKGMDTSSEFLEITTTNTLLTNSGNILFSRDSSFNEIQSTDLSQEGIILDLKNAYNFGVVKRIGGNKFGNKWPFYKLDGSPDQVSQENTNPVLLPLGTRVTTLKIDYVNVPKLNKSKIKVYLWYSKKGFIGKGFRLGYIDVFVRRTFVIPRATPKNYKDYPTEVLESFINDMELYMFITLSNMNSITDDYNNYNASRYAKYKQFVTTTGKKVNSFRERYENALIDLDNSEYDTFNTLYTQFNQFLKEEILQINSANYKTIVPLNNLSNGNHFFEDKIQAASDYYNIIKSTGIVNNRFVVFVPSPITEFSLSNPDLDKISHFTINQTAGSESETSILNGFVNLFGVSEVSDLVDIITEEPPDPSDVIVKQTIISSNIPGANGARYLVDLKDEFSTSNLTCNNQDVILSRTNEILPIDYDFLSKYESIMNFILENFKEGNEAFLDMLIGSDWETGTAIDTVSTIKLKNILKEVSFEIWGTANPNYNLLRQTREANWLKINFFNSLISSSVKNYVVLGDRVWKPKGSSNLFFQHHGSLVGIDQSIGVLNSNPMLSTTIHEGNQLEMFINLLPEDKTSTHNPIEEIEEIWSEYKDALIPPSFILSHSMGLLQINYHIPLIYIHYYLSKMDF
jgi:hypothetical protein